MGLFLLIYPSRSVRRVLLIAPDIRSTPRLATSDSGFAFALSEPGCLLPFFGNPESRNPHFQKTQQFRGESGFVFAFFLITETSRNDSGAHLGAATA
jgi:hypothetical protein